jgi:acetoacetyl-CoA synthetase
VSYKDKPEKLVSLKTILSTGSPLMENGYDYVYTHIKRDVQLSSQSGGTDFNGWYPILHRSNFLFFVYFGSFVFI